MTELVTLFSFTISLCVFSLFPYCLLGCVLPIHSSLPSPILPPSISPSLNCPVFPFFLPYTPSTMMTTPLPAPNARGIDFNLPTCGDTRCNGNGVCMPPPGGGTYFVCNCNLGYRGQSCEDTVNGSLSVPLTLSVLGVIIGLLILAFIFAKLRRRQKKKQRY